MYDSSTHLVGKILYIYIEYVRFCLVGFMAL